MRHVLFGPIVLAAALSASGVAGAGENADRAASLAQEIARLPATADPARRAELQARLRDAKQKVATVVVKLDVEGATVFVDGEPAAVTPLTRPLYLEPGTHVLAAEAPGREFVPIEGEFAAGQNVSVRLRALEPEAGSSDAAEPPAATGPDKPVWPGVVLGVFSGVSTAVGIGLVVASVERENEADALAATIPSCNLDSLDRPCADLAGVVSERNAFRDGGIVSLVVGGVAAAAMVAYLLVPIPVEDPEAEKKNAASLTIAPWAGPGTAGLGLRGAFE